MLLISENIFLLKLMKPSIRLFLIQIVAYIHQRPISFFLSSLTNVDYCCTIKQYKINFKNCVY